MNERGADPDDAVDLSPTPLSGHERHLAAALRTALKPNDLNEVHVRSLLDDATRTANRRRQLRRTTTPALMLSTVAAVVGCIVGVGLLLPNSAVSETPTAQTATVGDEDQRSAFLSLSEVQTVVPEAGLAIPQGKYWPTPPGEPLWTACSSDAIRGITPPAAVQRGSWVSRSSATPAPAGALHDVGKNAASTAPSMLTAVVATFGSAEQAADYARAFQASVDSCAAAGEVPVLLGVGPIGTGESGTALLPPDRDREGLSVDSHVWDLQDGRWHVNSVVVRDQVAVRLDAVVPEGSGQATGSTYRAAVSAVDDLAVLAADRAAAS